MFGDDNGGLGGLGGYLSGVVQNPLFLAGLQMLGNNSPRIGQLPNTMEGVPQTMIAAANAQRQAAQQRMLNEERARQRADEEAGRGATAEMLQNLGGLPPDQARRAAYGGAGVVAPYLKERDRVREEEETNKFFPPNPQTTIPPPVEPPSVPQQRSQTEPGESDEIKTAIADTASKFDDFALSIANGGNFKTIGQVAQDMPNQTKAAQFLYSANKAGLSPDTQLTREALTDPITGVALARGAGLGAGLSDEQLQQAQASAAEKSRARQAARLAEQQAASPRMQNAGPYAANEPQPQMQNAGPYAASEPRPPLQPLAGGNAQQPAQGTLSDPRVWQQAIQRQQQQQQAPRPAPQPRQNPQQPQQQPAPADSETPPTQQPAPQQQPAPAEPAPQQTETSRARVAYAQKRIKELEGVITENERYAGYKKNPRIATAAQGRIERAAQEIKELRGVMPEYAKDVKYSVSPIFGTDKDGNPVMLQAGNNGTAVVTRVEDGVTISKNPIKMDAGTEWVLLDPITRQEVGRIKKNVAEEAAQREEGKAEGKARGEAKTALPTVISNAEDMLKQIQAVRKHKDKEAGVGPLVGRVGPIPYVNQDFVERVDQLKGKSFLEAYKTLRGGGAITEVEGEKGTTAIARLNRAKTVGEFDEALRDLEDVVKTGLTNARKKAGEDREGPASSRRTKTGVQWSIER